MVSLCKQEIVDNSNWGIFIAISVTFGGIEDIHLFSPIVSENAQIDCVFGPMLTECLFAQNFRPNK